MSLLRGLRLSLRGASEVVATVAVAIAVSMEIMAAAATATREVTLPRRGGAIMGCDVDEVRGYAPDNAAADATAEKFSRTWLRYREIWGHEPCWAL